MDITASLFGTTAAPGLAAPAGPAAPADVTAGFAAALGQVSPTGAAPAPPPTAPVPAIAPPLPGAALTLVDLAPPVADAPPASPATEAEGVPGPLQPVPGDIPAEPWMTARPQPGRPGKLPRPVAANQPAPAPVLPPAPLAEAPVAPAPRPGERPALVAEFASLPAPAPDAPVEAPAEPAPAPVLVAIAASLPERVARAAPTAEAELSLEAPAPAPNATAAPRPEPRLAAAEAEPDFTPAATGAPERAIAEPVVARAEAPVASPAPPSASASATTTAPGSAASPAPVEQAAAPQAPVAPVAPPVPTPVRASLTTGFGERIGLAIARRLGEGGDEMTVRMEPAELGRIQVKLSFDEQGSLRAVLSAETAAVIDALRRDSADLARALGDAGVRTDAQSFRFDRGGAGEQGQSAWARWQAQHGGRDTPADGGAPADEQIYRPARRNGRLDLMA